MRKIDLSGQIWSQFEQAKTQAKRLLESGRGAEAAGQYRRCADLLRQYAQYAITVDVGKQWLERADEYQKLASNVESRRDKKRVTETSPEQDYREIVQSLVTETDVSWGDIGGLDNTKREIQMAYALALARKPQGVQLSGVRNILLYGPPGTGKTLLAAATSHELDATFFDVQSSDILSKYFGESTKLVSALYAEAASAAPSVIFLDEFDALTTSREGSDSSAGRRVLSTLLAELDGLEDKHRAPPPPTCSPSPQQMCPGTSTRP